MYCKICLGIDSSTLPPRGRCVYNTPPGGDPSPSALCLIVEGHFLTITVKSVPWVLTSDSFILTRYFTKLIFEVIRQPSGFSLHSLMQSLITLPQLFIIRFILDDGHYKFSYQSSVGHSPVALCITKPFWLLHS